MNQQTAEKVCYQGIREKNIGHYEDAMALFETAARDGSAEAFRQLGDMYEYGKGCIPDLGKAEGYYIEAVEAGDLYAGQQLARVQEEILRRQAENRPLRDVDAMFARGEEYYFSGKPGYFPHYLEAARYGHADAMFRVGYCYANGHDVEKNDGEAAYWYEQAALHGQPYGMYYAAVCYANGKGCETDCDRALLYARKSRKAGNPDAEYLIPEIIRLKESGRNAYVYHMEDHKASDMKELRRVISRIVNREYENETYLANRDQLQQIPFPEKINNRDDYTSLLLRAKMGDAKAMRHLGLMHLENDPDEVNPSADEGYRWLMLAAKHGDIDAIRVMVTIFAGKDPGPVLREDKPLDLIPVGQDLPFAWDLLRMLSWIHIDGLRALAEWYETGRFLEKPDYVEAYEANKSLLSYRILSKKYREDWKERLPEERKTSFDCRDNAYISMMTCLIHIGGDRYTREAEEWIPFAVKEKADIFDDLAILFIISGREDLLQFTAERSDICSLAAGEFYRTGRARLKAKDAWFITDKSFSKSLFYRYYNRAVALGFRDNLTDLIEVVEKMFLDDSAESMKMIADMMDAFNRMLASCGVENRALTPDCLDLLMTPDLEQLGLAKKKIIRLLLKKPEEERTAEYLKELDGPLQVLRDCYPKPDQLFVFLPQVSSRDYHFTYYEELIHQNYDLSGADFSDNTRLDVCVDKAIWAAAHLARIHAGSRIAARIMEWEFPENLGDSIDNAVEEYLDMAGGEIMGYWPGLYPIAFVRYNRMENGQVIPCEKSYSYMDNCDAPDSMARIFREEGMDWSGTGREKIAELLGSRTSIRKMYAYVQALAENDTDSACFRENLRKLYRGICFRDLWYQALTEQKEGMSPDPMTKNWKIIYRYFAGLLTN